MSSNTIEAENWTTIQGKSFVTKRTINAEVKQELEIELPAAKTGTLGVRTDNTTGTVTGTSGHGVLTADKLDIYWSTGSRRNVTVGTVSGNSIPISGGSGDNLPLATTALQFQVPVQQTIAVVGDDVVGILASLPTGVKGQVSIMDGSGELALVPIGLTDNPNQSYVWLSGSGVTNPLASDTVTKVTMSQNGTAVKTMSFVLFSN